MSKRYESIMAENLTDLEQRINNLYLSKDVRWRLVNITVHRSVTERLCWTAHLEWSRE